MLSASALQWDPLETPVEVGRTQTKSVLLQNQGTEALRLSSAPTVTGSNQFSATSACPATLAAGASCATTGAYSPTNTETAQGTLSFETSQGLKTVSLVGAPAYSSATLTAAGGTSFGTLLALLSKSLSFTVANTGSVPMSQVMVATDSASVLVTASTCGTQAAPVQSLAPGATCSVTVTWTPTEAGELAASLRVFSAGAAVGQSALTGSAAQSTPHCFARRGLSGLE